MHRVHPNTPRDSAPAQRRSTVDGNNVALLEGQWAGGILAETIRGLNGEGTTVSIFVLHLSLFLDGFHRKVTAAAATAVLY